MSKSPIEHLLSGFFPPPRRESRDDSRSGDPRRGDLQGFLADLPLDRIIGLVDRPSTPSRPDPRQRPEPGRYAPWAPPTDMRMSFPPRLFDVIDHLRTDTEESDTGQTLVIRVGLEVGKDDVDIETNDEGTEMHVTVRYVGKNVSSTMTRHIKLDGGKRFDVEAITANLVDGDVIVEAPYVVDTVADDPDSSVIKVKVGKSDKTGDSASADAPTPKTGKSTSGKPSGAKASRPATKQAPKKATDK